MKSAVIGLGTAGKIHCEIIAKCDELVAVCDIDESKFSLYPSVKHYTDYKKMLQEVKPDVVHICTPHYLHTEMVIFALEENVNVFCEKPLCIDKNDIPKILTAESKSKAMLGVCHQNRYNDASIFVKEYLKDKKILGANGYVSWKRDVSYYNSDEWRGKWATEGGGVLINQALHTFDLMQWFTTYPSSISAVASNLSMQGQIEVEDTVSIVANCNDFKFTFFATNANSKNIPVSISIYTDKGLISIIDGKVMIDNEIKTFDSYGKFYGKTYYGSGHEVIIKDFYDCVEENKKFDIDGAEGAKVVNMILASYSSNGEEIKL